MNPTKADMLKINTALSNLEKEGALHTAAMEHCQEEIARLHSIISKLEDKLHNSVHNLDGKQQSMTTESAVMTRRFDDMEKRFEKWDNRFWGIVTLILAGFITLIVAVLRKSP